jgi:hypothetical protein
VFEDLADRLAAAGAWRQGRNAGRSARQQDEDEDEDEELELICWSLVPDAASDSDLDRLGPELAGDGLFTLDLGEGPLEVEPRLRREFEGGPDSARSSSMPVDDSLFPAAAPGGDAGQGAWIRKRTSRFPRLFGRRAS